jgi:hypothetical protein
VQTDKLKEHLMRISLAVAILCLLVVGARMRGQEKAAPDRSDPGEGFHRISVKIRQKDLVVHAREEYYWGQ